MDMAASIAAHRYARNTVVTASIERTDFLTPVYEGELVEVTGKVIRTGRTSLVVQVELVAENLLNGERRLCTRGVFNMVALDKTGKPTPVPPLASES
jgi:acyl-CoA hydrolase